MICISEPVAYGFSTTTQDVEMASQEGKQGLRVVSDIWIPYLGSVYVYLMSRKPGKPFYFCPRSSFCS